jgi:hypothetical protein
VCEIEKDRIDCHAMPNIGRNVVMPPLHSHSLLGKGLVCGDYRMLGFVVGGASISAGAVQPAVCPSRFYCPAVDSTLDALPRVCPVGAFCNQTGLAAAMLCPAGYESALTSSRL